MNVRRLRRVYINNKYIIVLLADNDATVVYYNIGGAKLVFAVYCTLGTDRGGTGSYDFQSIFNKENIILVYLFLTNEPH